jgi:CcmD family protein
MSEHLPFLFAAYAVVWIGVLLYITALSRRSRSLERDIEELRSLMKK